MTKSIFAFTRKKLLALLFVIVALPVFGQNAAFSSSEVTWYGIDFSKAILIGPGFSNPVAIRDQFFKSWNELIIKEYKKYDLGKFFRKRNVIFNLDPVLSRNLAVDVNKLTALNSSEALMKDSDVKKIIGEYDFKDKEGVGVLMIVESLNNIDKAGYYYIVFFDIKTKEILLSKKISGKAKGAGFRNYWAGSFFEAFKSCEDNMSKWQKEDNWK